MAAHLRSQLAGRVAEDAGASALADGSSSGKIEDLSGKRYEGPLEKAGVSTQLTRDSAAALLHRRHRRRRRAAAAAVPPS